MVGEKFSHILSTAIIGNSSILFFKVIKYRNDGKYMKNILKISYKSLEAVFVLYFCKQQWNSPLAGGVIDTTAQIYS